MGTRATVLVVDDEPGIRDMLAYELSAEGFEVETADCGAVAVAAVKRRKFDVAVTDLKMPVMDGAATLEALRALDPDLEVIVATGYASIETAVDCMKRGAYDYIQKPYDPLELMLLLDRAVLKSHLQSTIALYEASRALLATLDPRELIGLVTTLSCRVLRADDAALVLDREGRPPEIHRSSAGSTFEAQVFLEAAERGAMDPSSGSALTYALRSGDCVFGVLVALRSPSSPPFSASEIQRGSVFANQVALSLDNASLHHDLAEKISELVRAREQLVQTEKLALAGRLAGAVAHEVNNPLTIIRGNLDALRDLSFGLSELWLGAKSTALYLESQPGSEAQAQAKRLMGSDPLRTQRLVHDVTEMIDETLEGATRIAELVKGFSQLSRPRPAAMPNRIDLNDIIKECLAALPEKDEGRFRMASPENALACQTLASGEDLKASLMSLMSFLCAPERTRTDDRGEIAIATGTRTGRPTVLLSDRTLLLTPEEQRAMFDPRVEPSARGRGSIRLNLALSLAYQMLRRNDAEITVETDPGGGTTLQIALPLPQDESS